ncbi:MAG TPA: hypothetical protein V6C84_18570 [Coleofasciculaceae cyanobacterium]|jgi:SulP family sulfate permease
MNLISLRQALHPQQSLSSLSVGLTTGAIGVVFDLSYAVLIFSGSLASHLSAGIGLILLSAATTRIAIAITSSFPGMVADLGSVPTAILAWSMGMVVKQIPATAASTEIFATVVATIALTSVLTGLCLLLGTLRMDSGLGGCHDSNSPAPLGYSNAIATVAADIKFYSLIDTRRQPQ